MIKWEADPLYFIFKNEVPGVVKMHIHKLDPKDWIKLDATYYGQMKLRKQLMKENFEAVFVSRSAPSTEIAKIEVLDHLLENLDTYHSDKFRLYNETIGVENLILDEKIFLNAADPLVIASHLVQEDWIVMEWDEESSEYVLSSGILCFPMSWSLQQKFLKPLTKIHAPSREYDHISDNVANVFDSITPKGSVWRANWVLSNNLKSSFDLFSPISHRHEEKKNVSSEYDFEKTGKEIFLRVEYQTLRRLPKSNAVLFSIRTYQRPLEEFLSLPKQDAKALADAIRNLSDHARIYKGAHLWGPAALHYLDTLVQNAKL